MGMLVKGTWSEERIQNQDGRFVRPQSQFRDTITADGSSEFKPEAGRYHLYVAYSCPWAHRTIIFRKLKGLEDIISMAVAVPGARGQGWTFDDSFPGSTTDSTNEFRFLHQAYTAARPDYTGTVTVPTLWDRKRRTIVNNESSEIIRMFNSAFDCVGREPAITIRRRCAQKSTASTSSFTTGSITVSIAPVSPRHSQRTTRRWSGSSKD
jgi:glutathionyl-hydroquinone reductase